MGLSGREGGGGAVDEAARAIDKNADDTSFLRH